MTRLRQKETIYDLSLLALIWFGGMLVVNITGEFPLNDDWGYATTVKRLLDEGLFRPTGNTSMSLFTQTLWGALFSKMAGFSYLTLRWSSLVAGFIDIMAGYFLMREVHPSRKLALLAAATFGFCPLHVCLACSFMTDVPFCAMFVSAALFFVRYLKDRGTRDYALAATFSVAAVLCRQVGLCLPLAFGVCILLRDGVHRRHLIRSAIPLILSAGSLVALNTWMARRGFTPAIYQVKEAQVAALWTTPSELVRIASKNILRFGLELGLLLLPLLLVASSRMRALPTHPVARRTTYVAVGAFIAMALTTMISARKLLPLEDNTLNSTGLGPLLLRDTSILKQPDFDALPWGIIFSFTIGSLVGGSLMIMILLPKLTKWGITQLKSFPRIRIPPLQTPTALLLLSTAIYLVPVLGMSGFFDRYLLPLIPLLLASLLAVVNHDEGDPGTSLIGERLAVGCVVCSTVFSFLGTHDYLSWNRSRWEVLNDLVEVQKISPESIDGGFEFNGLHFYSPYQVKTPGKSWWWVKDDLYLVTFGPVEGYESIGKHSFNRWLPPRTGYIYTLKKILPPAELSAEKDANAGTHSKKPD